ncbi:uracil-DNA glycosylase family protein [Oryzisolibacter sp. LB2S]|uniref:uracil-DNA glycosylase family protein n=1 Tax=Alicycliphilus soli TaxID=3228789 RepID=UPI00345B3217
MSLDLDARQRAMLQEMGVTVWAPQPAAPMPAPAPATAASPAPAGDPARTSAHTPAAQPPARPPARPPTTPARAPAAAPHPVGSGAAPAAPAGAAGLLLQPPQALYPQADAAATPAALGAAWLVVLESPTAHPALAADVEQLLDNMLRAMGLHRHPRTFVARLERVGAGAPAGTGQEPGVGLQQALAQLRPSMVLVLGLAAARAVLGNREPLGRLRAGAHHLADGTPAVVSYDPAYLLRAPEAKAAAWADLCRALALVREAEHR